MRFDSSALARSTTPWPDMIIAQLHIKHTEIRAVDTRRHNAALGIHERERRSRECDDELQPSANRDYDRSVPVCCMKQRVGGLAREPSTTPTFFKRSLVIHPLPREKSILYTLSTRT